ADSLLHERVSCRKSRSVRSWVWSASRKLDRSRYNRRLRAAPRGLSQDYALIFPLRSRALLCAAQPLSNRHPARRARLLPELFARFRRDHSQSAAWKIGTSVRATAPQDRQARQWIVSFREAGSNQRRLRPLLQRRELRSILQRSRDPRYRRDDNRAVSS